MVELLPYADDFLKGFYTTVVINVLAGILSILVGFSAALIALSRFAVPRLIVRLYIEFMRGIPILILLFIIYFVGPKAGFVLNSFTTGVIGLGLYNGAYVAEIIRANLLTIPKGQAEACSALGIPKRYQFIRILLPQLLVSSIPSLTNQFIMMLKNSTVVSIITVGDLLAIAKMVVSESFSYIAPFFIISIVYWVLAYLLSLVGNRLENRLSAHLK
ncbi:amino acid ABC transporter permease [Paenibacillus beijingensis]|uniref:ABC transmembrane type-1 domain-containing protein n=1 Tax=Paenibacillus beijingensis TaxID=1126833 RepID=A0A0D5NEB3_9BACL|nr:amino acid ABC transporter permease [Paenibacillus beijingensis]AJY73500.1 hypothetical protein VN24_01255 [Paenibacillus beijingensis]